MAKTVGSITLAEIIAVKNGVVPANYVVDRLRRGESITGIAFDLGVSEVALRAFLKRRGYLPNGEPIVKAA